MVCDDVLDEGQRSSSSLEAAGTGRPGSLITLTNECYSRSASIEVCSQFPSSSFVCVCVWSMLLWL